MSAEHQASLKETFDVQAMGCGNTAPAVLHSALAEWLYHERMIYVFQWFGEWILFVEEWETPGTTSICQHNPNPWKAVKGLLFTVASAKCFRAYFARKSRDSRRQNERTLLILCASVTVNGVNSNDFCAVRYVYRRGISCISARWGVYWKGAAGADGSDGKNTEKERYG